MKGLMRSSLGLFLVILSGCAQRPPEPESAPVARATTASSEPTPGPETSSPSPNGEAASPRRIGKLPKEAIRETIQRERVRIQACYHGARERLPELTGALNLRFVIAENGTVEELTVRPDTTLLDIKMQECVLEIFRRLEFPHPENGVVVVNYPFQFEVDKSGPGSKPDSASDR
jgi:hypothetical protein